jgi:hypothetical protein
MDRSPPIRQKEADDDKRNQQRPEGNACGQDMREECHKCGNYSDDSRCNDFAPDRVMPDSLDGFEHLLFHLHKPSARNISRKSNYFIFSSWKS